MDRVLIGHNHNNPSTTDNTGFWVSKPNVNVTALVGNSYFQGSIYGWNETFEWTNDSTYTYGFVDQQTSTLRVQTTLNGTILFTSNVNDPKFTVTLNAAPLGSSSNYPSIGIDRAFNGKDYPLLEMRLRRPKKSDGNDWTTDDFDESGGDFQIFWRSSNSTIVSSGNYTGYPWTVPHYAYPKDGVDDYDGWPSVLGVDGEWATLEYDFENQIVRANTGGTILTFGMNGGTKKGDWYSDTWIDGLRFDFFGNYQSPITDEPDLEIDYIRAKKREIPMNFGDSANDSFLFDSDWLRTALIHQSGTVIIGNEYAWANGTSKHSGTSHRGSTSGTISFPELPYIPVVLFQRFDDSSLTEKNAFAGGDKEFSHSICEISQPTLTWNAETRIWEDVANTNYGAEFRTFAYVRASKDHFDLTCRNAIARDGYEWLFNYAPQEPYIELYKKGNYDPHTESQDGIVLLKDDDLDDWFAKNDGDYSALHPSTTGDGKGYRGAGWPATDTGVWYYGNYKGTDRGNCLPTFDWANKFGDWNIPQFNSFYQYDGDDVSTYRNFKDAIGTSWTEANTKFLDDSMWMGNHLKPDGKWSNNAMEYRGDIWHPQAPTKTFSERGGLLGFGGQTHDGVRGLGRIVDIHGVGNSTVSSNWAYEPDKSIYGEAMGHYLKPRMGTDSSPGWRYIPQPPDYLPGPSRGAGVPIGTFGHETEDNKSMHIWEDWQQHTGGGVAHTAPIGDQLADGGETSAWHFASHHGLIGFRDDDGKPIADVFGYFPVTNDSAGGMGPGTCAMYDRPNNELKNFPPFANGVGWGFASDSNRYPVYATFETWGDPATTKSERYTITRSYTLPGATYAYDISNFSGPAHYDVWIKNEEMNDYVERNIKTYKTDQTFKRKDGTIPDSGDDRENTDPPLSATEIDEHRKDYWMINHFRQSYEYNLPGKSPHRDGTLRPFGYGPYPCSFDAYGTDIDYQDESGIRLGISVVQNDEGGWDGVEFEPKYPSSGLYVRPRFGKAGFGSNYMYAMQRHGEDQQIKSPRSYPNILIGGMTSDASNNTKTPPGLAESAHTINLYPMEAATDYTLGELGGRDACIVPMKNIMSGEMNMYSRHQQAINQYGVTGESKKQGSGAPWNIERDRNPIRGFQGHASDYTSSNDGRRESHSYHPAETNWYYLQGNIFPGMCKADNSLTYWGTEDLSEWGGGGAFPTREMARQATDGTYMNNSQRASVGGPSIPSAADYQPFSGLTKDLPEFQPITGDGRYFGAVGGINNRSPGFGDLLGPSLSPEPSVWDLKWNTISHPFAVAGVPDGGNEANATFYGTTSVNNQTSSIGGAPNARIQLDTPADYITPNPAHGSHQSTPLNYDWAIGAPRINCNEWDRKLKTKTLNTTKGNTAYHFQYTYDDTGSKIKPPVYRYWVLRVPAGLESIGYG